MSDGQAAGAQASSPIPMRALMTVYGIMGGRRRLQLTGTMLLMLVGAIAELLTIGAVLPLLALAANPDYFKDVPAALLVLRLFGGEAGGNPIVPAAMLLVTAAISAAAVRSALTWATHKLVYGLGYDISMRVFTRLLRQPYQQYVRQNSSAALSALEKIHIVANGILSPVMLAFTSAIIAVCIVAFLFVIDPLSASIAIAFVGAVYVGLSLVTKKALLAMSRRAAAVRTQRLKVVQELWGGMRDIILDQSQLIFERKLSEFEAEMKRLHVHSGFIIDSPRFVVESFGIITFALLAVYFSLQPGGVLAAIPVLGALAVGAQRLLPLVQAVYRGWATYSVNSQALQDVVDLMNLSVSTAHPPSSGSKPLPDKLTIEVQDLWFHYSEDQPVLRGINLAILSGERVAFVGKTGSGKSTLVDVLMGLLPPTGGRLLLGDVEISDANVAEWQARIAHVPQAIFLSDDSIAANIAFGSNSDEIDMERVLRAAERADIRGFVEQLPEGFSTTVGERGIRLSGGQRQRIGIARALYKNASVLVLDEATSALDAATEASVMESVAGLDRSLTVILIAHRLSTVQGCDTIYRLESGRIAQSGTYDEVVLAMHRAAG